MNKIVIALFGLVLASLSAGCSVKGAHSSCPEIQGSYKIENRAVLYITKKVTGDYMAIIGADENSADIIPVIIPTKEELTSQEYPMCSVILKGVGILMPSDKDEKYMVSDMSQNYVSERKPGTPLVLMVMAGFVSDIYGVVKTSDSLPENIVSSLSKGNAK